MSFSLFRLPAGQKKGGQMTDSALPYSPRGGAPVALQQSRILRTRGAILSDLPSGRFFEVNF